MAAMQTNIPVPASRKTRCNEKPQPVEAKTTNKATPSQQSLEISNMPQRSSMPKVPRSTVRLTRTATSRSIPVVVSASPPFSLATVSKSSTSGDESESSKSSETHSSLDGSTISKSSSRSSQYNGPQLVEPCVADALSHVLEPCGHRVLTRDVQPCGKNCKSSDSAFANAKTEAKFACAICISRYVQEHYEAKRLIFLPILDMLEEALGGFAPGWKDRRIARMERVWKNDALEERTALQKTGRYCEAISIGPEDEALMVLESAVPVEASPNAGVVVPHQTKMQTDRLKVPVSRASVRRSLLPTPSSPSSKPDETKAVEREGDKKKTSRIPVGPRLPRK